jgi:hypothetical protein
MLQSPCLMKRIPVVQSWREQSMYRMTQRKRSLAAIHGRGVLPQWFVFLVFLASAAALAAQDSADWATSGSLPGTEVLDWPEDDLSARMMDGAHRFVERQIAEAEDRRSRYWSIDDSSRESYEASIAENRQKLREIIGAVDPRSAPRLELYGEDLQPALVAETSAYRVFQVRWAVLEGVLAEGLLVQPKQPPVACVIALPDADRIPEQLLGISAGYRSGQPVRAATGRARL